MKYLSISLLFLCLAMTIVIVPSLANKSEKHPPVDFTVGCAECHQDVTPETFASWAASDHGIMNFGCYMCHGDGEVNFAKKPLDTSCMSCHDGKQYDRKKTPAKSCYDCHKGHSLKFHE